MKIKLIDFLITFICYFQVGLISATSSGPVFVCEGGDMDNFWCMPHDVSVFEKFENKKKSLVYYQGSHDQFQEKIKLIK